MKRSLDGKAAQGLWMDLKPTLTWRKILFDWRAKTIFIHHASLSHTATSDFKPSHPLTSSPKPQLSSAINHHLATGCWALSKVTLHPATPPPEVGSRGEREREREKKREGRRKRGRAIG